MYVGIIAQNKKPTKEERNRNEILRHINSIELLNAIGAAPDEYEELRRSRIFELQNSQRHHVVNVSNESFQ